MNETNLNSPNSTQGEIIDFYQTETLILKIVHLFSFQSCFIFDYLGDTKIISFLL